MKIFEIYKKFGIPPNLQEHMFRVAAVVSLVEKQWKGGYVDWNLTKKMALVHDLGNVVKMDNKNHPEFLGSEQINIEYWNNKQAEIIAKYGTDDNEATKEMLTELKIDPKIVNAVFSKRFLNSIHTKDSNDWSLIIMYYGDLRILPLGVGSLDERLVDIRSRYLNYVARPDFEDLVLACRDIEKMIQENLKISVDEINNITVNNEIEKNITIFKNLDM